MKRIVLLLSVLLLFITGCSAVKFDNGSIDTNIDVILSEKNKVCNVNFDGYKYYVPEGLRFVKKEEYNALLEDRFNNKYYLYVDAIGYYHDVELDYNEDFDAYYFEKLNYNKKDGYIKIVEVDSKYLIEFVFNYAKMEAYTSHESLIQAVNNMCYILRSIKFNDKILESLIGDNVLSYKEENYTLFEAESSQEDFLEVVSKYDLEYSKVKDQDEIELNDY